MKKILVVLIVVLVIGGGCGDAYYENIVSIGPMDEISGETQESMGNVFDNMSAVLANNTSI